MEIPAPQESPTQQTADLPRLREDLKLITSPDKTNHATRWLLHDPVMHKFYRLDAQAFEILQRWSLGNINAIVENMAHKTHHAIDSEDVEQMLSFLQQHQLILHDSEDYQHNLYHRYQAKQSHPLNCLLQHYLFIRIPLVHPDRFLKRTLSFATAIMSPPFLVFMLVLLSIGSYLVSRQWEQFTHSFVYFFQWQGWVIFAVSLVFSKIIHELGHAYTAKSFNLSVPSMGIAFMVMWPVLYTENSEGWTLSVTAHRLKIGAAGMIAEIYLAIICLFIWSFLPDGALKSAAFMLATSTWILTLLVNLNPLMRFDGYFLLSDGLGVENLQERSFLLAKWKLRQLLLGIQGPPPEYFPPKRQRLLISLAWLTWIYRFFLFLGIALLVYHFFFKAAGIILMLVELIWFIGKPIYHELKQWQTLRTHMQWNTQSIISALVLTGLCFALFLPWQTHLNLPSLMQANVYSDLYTNTPAKIIQIHINEGDQVSFGQPLIQLESPELERHIQQAKQQRDVLTLDLARKSSSNLYLEYRQLLTQQLASAQATYQALIEQQQQLKITAPHAGTLVYLNPEIQQHPWINPSIKLAKIIQPQGIKIRAYIQETQLSRLSLQAKGFFYPENNPQHRYALKLQRINTTPSQQLDSPYLASPFQGQIATRQTAQNTLEPEGTWYELQLQLTTSLDQPIERITRGQVIIEATAESYFQQVLRQIQQVFQRELGGI